MHALVRETKVLLSGTPLDTFVIRNFIRVKRVHLLKKKIASLCG